MKKFAIVSLLILLVSRGFSVGVVDLTLQSEVNDEYLAYLDSMEQVYQDVLQNPQNNEETMKAYCGLTLIYLAYSDMVADTTLDYAHDSFYDLLFTLFGMQMLVYENLQQLLEDVSSPHELVFNLIDYLDSGNLSAFESAMDSMSWQLDEIGNELDSILTAGGSNLGYNLDEAGYYFAALMDSTADFSYNFQVLGSDYEDEIFEINREFLDALDSTLMILEESVVSFDEGLSQLDSLFQEPEGDISPAVDEIRAGLDTFEDFLQSCSDLTTMPPLSAFEIDTAIFDSISLVVEELDTLLGGKEYPFGPEEEGKSIKPLAILESIPEGWDAVVKPFYWSSTNQYSYTFNGIFPEGLPEELVDLIKEDLILNSYSTREVYEIELEAKRLVYQWMLLEAPPPIGDGDPSNDGDAHFGLALLDLYDLAGDINTNVSRLINLLSSGHLDSLSMEFNLEQFDYTDELAGILDHLNAVLEDDYFTIFTILIKNTPDDYPDFIIDNGSEFSILMITEGEISTMATSLEALLQAGESFVAFASNLWDEASQMMDLSLNPNYLDLSDVESDSELILILESANPDFMTLTPYGVERMHQLGYQLEQYSYVLAMGLDYLFFMVDTLAEYEDSLGIELSSALYPLWLVDSLMWEINEDFTYPDSTIMINGERVNLSAWFDNPPESFLMMWKAFVWGVDSTLGGLFPDRKTVPIDYGQLQIPEKLKLYPAFPNPFNPGTFITFDLPYSTDVTVEVFNLLGEKVVTLLNRKELPGRRVIYWDATGLSSGTYFIRLTTGDGKSDLEKVLLIK